VKSRREKLSYNGALVLQALARGYRYGFEIMDFTGLPSGTAYPILRRFELERLARSRWEGERPAQRDGRPRRRYYELTEEGRKLLSAALERFSEHRRVFDDAVAEPESSR
jgi:PadR family transcriptional regulator, regulatory protein PadR